MTAVATHHVDAVATDGRVVQVRPLTPDDLPAVERLHDEACERSIYLRYFSPNREAARRYLPRLVAPTDDHYALGAFCAGRLVAVGMYEQVDARTAEFALQVADDEQHHGLGTLLLEHVAAAARARGVETFVAEVLAENVRMLEVLHDLGFRVHSTTEAGTVQVDFPLTEVASAVAAADHRDQLAERASLRPLLAPRSVAVVGAGASPGTVGHEILRNLRAAGFTGTVHVVNPHHDEVLGVPAFPSVTALPDAVDLAVVAVPAAAVADVVRACGRRGCRGVLVVASGFGEAGLRGLQRQNEVLDIARSAGMRVIGPNCVGLLNNDPAIRLDATFGRLAHRPGRLAIMAQSGAFGIGLVDAADRLGLGVHQFVSLGNKADVGGNDLLLAWAEDPAVGAVAMYLESVDDPIRFAHVAGLVSRRIPLLALKSGRTDIGRRAGRSHTAAAAAPDALVDALFASCGVQRVGTTDELLAAARVVAGTPAPAGPRLAIVGNSGGPEILAADAAAEAGLHVVDLDAPTAEALRALGTAGTNPLDLGAGAQPELVARALAVVAASPSVDILLTVFTDVAVVDAGRLHHTILDSARSPKPLVAVEVGGADTCTPVEGTGHWLPVFGTPEPAVRALGVAWRAARHRLTPSVPGRPDGLRRDAAAEIVAAASGAGGSWLRQDETQRLLQYYGLHSCPQRVVVGAEAAIEAARALGYPVAVKLAQPGMHKSDVGGVRLGLDGPEEVREAVERLTGLGYGTSVVVAAMAAPGPEFIIGGIHDPRFGPLVMFGTGGVGTDSAGDQVFRLAPLDQAGAEDLLASTPAARLLEGVRGSAPVSRWAMRDAIARVSALLADHPAIAEIDLNPVRGAGERVVALDARIRVAPPPLHSDPLVRRLRPPRPVDADVDVD